MTATITFQTLLDGEAPDMFITQIEGFTGSREVFGYNTPIDVLTILAELGIESAVNALNYAVEDVRFAAQNVALDWVAENIAPWDYATESNARLRELLFQGAQYLNAVDTTTTPRLNYCGEPLDSGLFRSSDELISFADNLQEYINNLNFVGTPQVYYNVVANGSGSVAPPNRPGFTVLYGPVCDPCREAYLPVVSQSNDLIADILSDPLKVSFIQTSDTLDQQTISAFYSAKGYWIGVALSFWNGQETLRNPLTDAAYGIGQAAINTVTMIADNANYLDSVMSSIVGAFATYREGRLREVNRIYARMNTIGDTGAIPLGQDSYDTAIRNYEIADRNAKLSDYTWLKQFDTDNNDRISRSERGLMELAVRKARIEARKVKASELASALKAEMDIYLNLEASLVGIFTLYFS